MKCVETIRMENGVLTRTHMYYYTSSPEDVEQREVDRLARATLSYVNGQEVSDSDRRFICGMLSDLRLELAHIANYEYYGIDIVALVGLYRHYAKEGWWRRNLRDLWEHLVWIFWCAVALGVIAFIVWLFE